MQYENITTGIFLERPNRFLAKVEVEGCIETVHVKNTGRCRELLVPGAQVYLDRSHVPGRKTLYDLVAVQKGERLINMDSQAPNRAVDQWLQEGGLFPSPSLVRPETKYGNSRFDFYVEADGEKIFIEVKGVTLEEEGVVRFPDAPSERAVKHVEELVAAKRDGYRAFVLFVIQMEKVSYFMPNQDTHPAFAQALCAAAREGVEILAYDCHVTENTMHLRQRVPVILGEEDFGKNSVPVKKTLKIGVLQAIPKPLLKWYDENRRILPWREEPTPYRVWISEIMLQQTRVEAVKSYFERFMGALPHIKALAEVEEETLLKLWEGLGYYNRARNLQKAAIQICQDYGGVMPDTYEELLKLTGIGSYTAGAVASIAFGRPEPAVDGNVLRVVSRIREDGRLISEPKVKAAVEQELRAVMPQRRPGDFNQAMMELGACVCIPNGAPLCHACPLAEVCMAHLHGTQLSYPRKAPKKARTVEEKTILVVRDAMCAAIRRRPSRGLLAGMYEFPSMEGFHTPKEVVAYLAANGIKVLRIQPLEDGRHIFTHREWHMKGYMVRVDELEQEHPGEQVRDWCYIPPEEILDRYPIPSAFATYTKYLNIELKHWKYEEENRL